MIQMEGFKIRASRRLITMLMDYMVWFIYLGVVSVFSLGIPGFLSIINFSNIFLRIAAFGLVALGESLCLICGKFDLSVGSIVVFTGMLTGWLVITGESYTSGLGLNPYLGILLALTVATGIGAFNGFMITKFRMNAFLQTLAVMVIFRGLGLAMTFGHNLYNFPRDPFWTLGSGRIWGIIPVCVLVMLVIYGIFHFILSSTRFGAHMYATGGNPYAAFVVGVNVNRVIFTAFTLSGFLSGFAGILLVGRLMMAEVWGGEPYLFLSFAASVLGGVSLFGGIGSLVGTLGGVLILETIDNGLHLLGISPFWIRVAEGLLILTVIIIYTIKVRR